MLDELTKYKISQKTISHLSFNIEIKIHLCGIKNLNTHFSIRKNDCFSPKF